MSLIADIASYVRPYNSEIAVALVATALVIFGGAINEMVRSLVRTQPIWLRVIVFILLCAIGYGLLAAWLTAELRSFLAGLSSGIYLLAVSGAFITVGILAERSRWR